MQNNNDIELAITGFQKDQRKIVMANIPQGYTVEERSTGYGLVVRSKLSDANKEINSKLEGFLKPLLPLAKEIKDRDCILRVAIFTSAVAITRTFDFSCFDLLAKFHAKLEVSVYPIDEEPSAVKQGTNRSGSPKFKRK